MVMPRKSTPGNPGDADDTLQGQMRARCVLLLQDCGQTLRTAVRLKHPHWDYGRVERELMRLTDEMPRRNGNYTWLDTSRLVSDEEIAEYACDVSRMVIAYLEGK